MRIVILAGGGGSRMWPMSRKDKPKQFPSNLGKDHVGRDFGAFW